MAVSFSYELCHHLPYIALLGSTMGFTIQNACNELCTIKWILWLLLFKRESNKLLVIKIL